MSQLLALARPFSFGFGMLAQRLGRGAGRRHPPFALTEPAVFRSECFAEDLPEHAVKPMKHGRAFAKRR